MTDPYAVPAEMRDFADRSVQQARKALEGFMGAVKNSTGAIEEATSAAPVNVSVGANRVVALAEKNVTAAFDLAEKLVHAHKIEMLGYLHKPVNPEYLSELIKKWKSPSQEDQLQSSKKIYRVDELQSAIAHHELVNYYQPKVSVATGEVIGVETLVRWHHPTDGLISPDRFISIAEENNLINSTTYPSS